jgi:hypothetical protein
MHVNTYIHTYIHTYIDTYTGVPGAENFTPDAVVTLLTLLLHRCAGSRELHAGCCVHGEVTGRGLPDGYALTLLLHCYHTVVRR